MDNLANLHEVDVGSDNSGHPSDLEMPAFLKPMSLSIERLQELAERIETADWLIDDSLREQVPGQRMVDIFSDVSLFLEIGEYSGVILVHDLKVGRSAVLSIYIWDKTWLRRRKEAKQTIAWLMRAFNLLRIGTIVTETNRMALRFNEQIGFKKEGRLANWFVRNGKPEAIICLGVTREEVTQWAEVV